MSYRFAHLPLLRRLARPAALALAVLSVVTTLSARPQDTQKIEATLPAAAQDVLHRLSSLRELPDGQWKMHSGDIAHGEALHVDESGWQAIAPRSKAPKDALWFRQTVTVPPTLNGYDLTGARIWFQFHAGANGPMPQIIYFNGRRVALGDDLEPIILDDEAKPGDSFTIAVKLLHTVDEKTFEGATYRIDFASKRPNPSDLNTEFLSAASLVPSLAPNDASKMTTLTSAIEAVDLKALDAKNQQAFDASLMTAQHKLEALKPLLEQITFHLTGNSHIDAAWLWPWTETVDVVKRTFGTALQLMYEYPQYTYTQSAAAYNEWMAQKYPEMNDEIKRRIQEGRWEVVGGMWVEPDLNMPDGESLVRQLLVGKRWYKQHYGVDVRIGWNPDSFGYTWQLPQIYKKSGVDYFVTQKMTWNDTNQLPFKLFWWESPDGSKVLTYFPQGYGNNDLRPTRLSDDMVSARERAPGLTEMMDLYGIGDHGGGPTRAVLDEGFHWKEGSPQAEEDPSIATNTVHPKMDFGLAQPFFSKVEKEIAPQSRTWNYASIAKGYEPPTPVPGKIAIPTWKSELYFEYHRGVMTTQANHKRNMREASIETLNAEKWASLAWLDGKAYPADEITEDWKKVLFNQFHDLGAGSGIGIIYKDAQKDYDVVRWSTNEIKANSLTTVAEHINTEGEGTPVLIYNPLGWERSGSVHIQAQLTGKGNYALWSEGSKSNPILPTQVHVDEKTGVTDMMVYIPNVPALGYRVFHLAPMKDHVADKTHMDESGDSITLHNAKMVVKIDKHNGCITSLALNGQETLTQGACGNELQAFKDTPKDYDAWNIDPGTLDVAPTLISKVDSVQLIESSQLHPAVRVTRTWQSSKFVQTISIPEGADYVDVDNQIDWHESHILLKAAFPMSVESDHATYDIPYGEIERTTKRTNSWEKAQFEVPAQLWADYSGAGADGKVHGLSVINDSKFGYDSVGNVLRLTLLRSPKWPDPEADMGHHHFHYALYPHAGTWKEAMTVRHGWEYNYPLQAVVTTAHPGSLPPSHSFVSIPEENVVLTAVKKAEDANGLILRAYEWAGKSGEVSFHVPPGATSATVTNMQETPEGSALPITHEKDGDVVKTPITPYEIQTIRVEYPGGPKM
jgi:alpha-mannosidase